MSTPSTNIRVFAHWTEQTVFAGEDIECHITFKNVASIPTLAKGSSQAPPANGFALGGQRKGPSSKNGHSLANKALPIRGHRATLSLNTPVTVARPPPVSGSWNGGSAKPKDGHKRSVSIISIGASESAVDETASHKSLGEASRKVIRGHGRSASLQIVPRRNGLVSGPTSAPVRHQSATQPSPLLVTSFSPSLPSATGTPKSGRSSRRPGVATAPGTPAIGGPHSARRQDSGSFAQNFRFPAASNLSAEARQVEALAGDEIDSANSNSRLLSPARDGVHHAYEHAAPAARILSPASIAGTPRSSGEFYSLASNNSSETLASEYLPHQPGRIPNFPSYSRRPSNLSPISQKPSSETLMMGYAQIHGSFTVDGSLISQAPFDEVKRKGAVGGQGGGVIGVETSKRNSGVFQFGWNNIGDSLSGLLGGGELSSIKDMRGIASSKSVPLLSTPQSILFVDLRLAPGESKTYKYSFSLPRGLPPSHRGKAIKISYKLVIGTQRPGGAKEQQVKSVEVPFRVLGSVNSHGELLGHDLMSPYIILQDQARVKMTTSPSISSLRSSRSTTKPTTKANQESSLTDFLSYVDELLTRPRQNSSYGLLSPTESPLNRRQSSVVEETTTAKEAIDLAILRSNTATEYQQSANRFEITRGGKRVAVVMLARPAYRLGETITAAFDFTNAEIPCYAIHASLETSEKIDSSLALRSEASVLRVTRKIYASHSESTLFARRVVFSPSIPSSATPEFITSGVNLDWRIRIEFVTPRLSHAAPDGDADAQPPQPTYTDLLEEVARDDRGVVLAAAEALDCESFEIAVPLRVYGALAGTAEKGEEAPVEGLVV